MARRIDWDSANRQAKLRKWIQNNDTYSWVDELPSSRGPELEEWAKRQVRKSVKKVLNEFENARKADSSPEGQISKILIEVQDHLDLGNFEECEKLITKVINLIVQSNLTDISIESRTQVVELVSLLSEINQ
jgi:hypothetical protein